MILPDSVLVPRKRGLTLTPQAFYVSSQLELSNDRETALIDEKSKLLDLLAAEKEEKRALMLPVDEQKPKTRNWLLRLVGAR